MAIDLTYDGNTAILTLNTPATLNALDDELVETAISHLQTLYEDNELEAIVLTGDNNVFSAGGNLHLLQRLASRLHEDSDSAPQIAKEIRNSARIVKLIRSSPVPTIAAIDGACAGAAIGWVGACDLRIASETAFFDTAYLKLGLSSDFGVAFCLTETVGAAVAKDWLLRPRRIPATEAYSRGFVTEIHPDQEHLMQSAMQIAQFLSAERHLGVQALRENVAEAQAGVALAEHLAAESQRFVTSLGAPTVAAQLERLTSSKPQS